MLHIKKRNEKYTLEIMYDEDNSTHLSAYFKYIKSFWIIVTSPKFSFPHRDFDRIESIYKNLSEVIENCF